jgi:hypothetical protein
MIVSEEAGVKLVASLEIDKRKYRKYYPNDCKHRRSGAVRTPSNSGFCAGATQLNPFPAQHDKPEYSDSQEKERCRR